MNYYVLFERVFWRGRQIIGAFTTIFMLIEADYLGGSLPPILEANRKSYMLWDFSCWCRVARSSLNFNEEPRTFGIENSVSSGLCRVSSFFGGAGRRYSIASLFLSNIGLSVNRKKREERNDDVDDGDDYISPFW